MRGRNGVAWFILACALFGVAGGAGGAPRRAEVVWPLVGGGLYYKGTIEVALEGLTQKEFDALSVRVEAVTDPGASVVGPICLWEGWPEVPVVTGSSGEGSAWINWVDRAAGRALLRVQWNYFPPGFRSGYYRVRVEVLVRSPGGGSDRWGYTNWHRVYLDPAQSPRLTVSLSCPNPMAEFGFGEPVRVAGLATDAVLPIWARLEIRRGEASGRWEPVAQGILDSAQVEMLCLAPQETLGLHYLRLIVVDSRGATGVSPEMPIMLIRRPLQVRLTQPEEGIQVLSGEEVAVRGQVLGAAFPVRVCLEARREVDPARWEAVGETTLVVPVLELRLDTGRLTSGTWYLRATARDSQGLTATSNEVRVIIREPRFAIRVTVKGKTPDAIEPVKERDQVKFELDAEGTWTRVAWEFGDGNSSNQEAPVHTYERAGTYKVCVTACGPGGSSRTTCATVEVAPRDVLVATRKIIGYPRPTCDGVTALVYHNPKDPTAPIKPVPVQVEVHIRVLEPVTAILLTERRPDGWEEPEFKGQEDVTGPVTVKGIPGGPEYSWVITPNFPQKQLPRGTEFTIAYKLTPKASSAYTAVDIEGWVHFREEPELAGTRKVGGASQVFVEPKLDPFVALLFLKKVADGEYDLAPPWENPRCVLNADLLENALDLITGRKGLPYADVHLLGPEDYLKLVAYFLGGRPVIDCPK